MKKSQDNEITICIPTYNRGKILKKNLQYLIKSNFRWPIIIIENHSENKDFYDEIENISSKLENIDFIRNDKNILFEGSLIKFFQIVKTRFMMILSDEDLPNVEFLENYEKIFKENGNIGMMRPSVAPFQGKSALNSVTFETKTFTASLDAVSTFSVIGNYISGQIYNVEISKRLKIHDSLIKNLNIQKVYPHIYLNMLYAAQSITVLTSAPSAFEGTPDTTGGAAEHAAGYFGTYSFGQRIDQFMAFREALIECYSLLKNKNQTQRDEVNAYLILVNKFFQLISITNNKAYREAGLSKQELLSSFGYFAISAYLERLSVQEDKNYLVSVVEKIKDQYLKKK